jgi:hypothetical protein
MKTISAFGLLSALIATSAAFAGGGGGGCGRIPHVVENKEVRCVGQVRAGTFSRTSFDKTFQYDSDLPYDQGNAEVVDFMVYAGRMSDRNLGITFHCDTYKDGKMVEAGKQFLLLGKTRMPINLGPNNRSIKNVTINNGGVSAVVSCYLQR